MSPNQSLQFIEILVVLRFFRPYRDFAVCSDQNEV